jgi:hypothetical protein
MTHPGQQTYDKNRPATETTWQQGTIKPHIRLLATFRKALRLQMNGL